MKNYKINVIYSENENLNKLITSALVLEIKKILKKSNYNRLKNLNRVSNKKEVQ